MARKSRKVKKRTLLIAATAGLVAFVAFLLFNVHERPRSGDGAGHDGLNDTSSSAKGAAPHLERTPVVTKRVAPKPVPIKDETPPWKATPKNSPPTPKHHIPAWKVNPPRPEPVAGPRKEPVPPPDPRTTQPAMTNVGGVNGDRPSRPVPGIDE